MPIIRIAALLGSAALMSAATQPLTGLWGAPGARLMLDPNGSRVEQDCATASFGPVRVDAQGRFKAQGRYDVHQPGPQQADVPSGVPARFEGTVKGDALTLTIVPETGPKQTLTLTKGKHFKIIRCL